MSSRPRARRLGRALAVLLSTSVVLPLLTVKSASASAAFSGDIERNGASTLASESFSTAPTEVQSAEPDVGDVERTPYTETTYLGDGQYQTNVSPEPMYRSEDDGSLTPLNDDVDQTDDRVAADDVLVPVTFDAPGQDANTVASFDVDGAPVEMKSLSVTPADPQVSDDGVVQFNTDDPAVQLNYVVSTGTVKEQIVLANPDAPRDFHFFLADPRGALGSVVRTDDGGYSFSGNGDLVAAVPPAVAWEVDDNGQPIPNAASGLKQSAHIEITPAAGGFAVHTWLDDGWAADKQFPIVLDPPVTWGYGRPGLSTVGAGPTLAKNVGVQNKWSTSCPSSAAQTCLAMFDYSFLYAGSVNNSTDNVSAIRSVFTWDYPSGAEHHAYDTPDSAPFNLPERAKVLDAQLWLDHAACVANPQPAAGADCGPTAGSKLLTVHRLTTKVNTNWNWTQINGAMAASGSSSTDPSMRTLRPPYKNDWTGLNAQIFSPGNWQALQIGEVVQGWVNNPAAGAGLVIRATDESVGNHGTYWLSNSVSTVGQRPFLSVHWEYQPTGKAQVTTSASGSNVKVDWSVPAVGTWPDNYYLQLKEHNTGIPIAGCTYKMLPGAPAPGETVCKAPPSSYQVPVPDTDFTFTNIPNGDYDAIVTSSNWSGVVSPQSDPAAIHVGSSSLAPLFQPTHVQASVSGISHTAQVTWTPATGSALLSVLSGYHVRAYNADTNALLPGDSSVAAAPLSTAPMSVPYSGLKNGTRVYFTVTAQLGGNDLVSTALVPTVSANSNTVTPYSIPFAPTVSDTQRDRQQVTVSWVAPGVQADGSPGDNGALINQYEVRVYVLGASSPAVVGTYEVGQALDEYSKTLTGLSYGPSYEATVRAHNAAGWGPESTRRAVERIAIPSKPTNVQATAAPSAGLVTWAASDPNGSAVSYVVTASPGGQTSPPTYGTSAKVEPLDSETSYTFTVTATNVAGSITSDPSNAITPLPTCTEEEGGTQEIRAMSTSGWPGGECTPTVATECANGIDDDHDGDIDYPDDSDCSNADDLTEAPPQPACSDSVDNDGDGDADYPADIDCLNATDRNEGDHLSSDPRYAAVQALTRRIDNGEKPFGDRNDCTGSGYNVTCPDIGGHTSVPIPETSPACATQHICSVTINGQLVDPVTLLMDTLTSRHLENFLTYMSGRVVRQCKYADGSGFVPGCYSNHSLGAAMDVRPLADNAKAHWDAIVDADPEGVRRVVLTFAQLGFRWGGSFDGNRDPQHFEFAGTTQALHYYEIMRAQGFKF
jgi:hypothetical protein